jgi:hypothetical protein
MWVWMILWYIGYFWGNYPYGREAQEMRLKTYGDTQEPARGSEWRQRNNREADRRDGQPLGNEGVSVAKEG